METVLEPKGNVDQKFKRVERVATVFAVEKPFAIPGPRSKEKPLELYHNLTKTFSPPFESNGKVRRGISPDKEKLIPAFASLLGIGTSSPNWEAHVREFWIEYEEKLPFGEIVDGEIQRGRVLNASYEIRDGVICPDDIQDYILYELLIVDKSVATNSSDWINKDNFKFFCVTREQIEAKKKELLDVETRATKAFVKLDTDPDSLDKMRYVLSIIPNSGIMAVRALRLERDDALREILKLSRERPKDLLDALNDKELATKALIAQLLETSTLEKIGRSYYYNKELIGELNDAILYLKSPSNASEVVRMKEQLSIFQHIEESNVNV